MRWGRGRVEEAVGSFLDEELPPLQGSGVFHSDKHRDAARSSAFLLSALPKRSERSAEEEERGSIDENGGHGGWEQSHSVALREKDSLGLDLPLPRMIFCSSFCCF